MPDQYLRPEANPVTYANLYPAQKTAYRRLSEMLAEAVGELPDPREKPRRDASAFRLDFSRKTRVALMSGGAGPGKPRPSFRSSTTSPSGKSRTKPPGRHPIRTGRRPDGLR